MNYALIGEMIGIVAIIQSFSIYLSNQRKRILLLKAVADVLWAANGFLVGAFAGGLLNGMMVLREFVFYHRIDRKWAQHPFWRYFFSAMCFLSPVLTFFKTGAWYLLAFVPAVGSVFCVQGFYSKEPARIRALNLIGTLPWLVYNVMTHNVTATISTIVGLCSILLGTLLANRKPKQKTV